MNFFNGEGSKDAFIIIVLAVWASLTLLLMLTRSWVAGNSNWVVIFIGLICLTSAFAVYAWRVLILDRKGGSGNEK